jgi:hypothetical protein
MNRSSKPKRGDDRNRTGAAFRSTIWTPPEDSMKRNRDVAPYGPQTYAEFMAEWEAEEMERYYNPKPLNPLAPPPGWDFDLWAEFARDVNAMRCPSAR